MNSSGRPPSPHFERGPPLGTISMDLLIFLLEFLYVLNNDVDLRDYLKTKPFGTHGSNQTTVRSLRLPHLRAAVVWYKF